jgi:hypothetical protein
MKSPDKRIRDDEATTADLLRIEQRARAIDDALANPDCRSARIRVDLYSDLLTRHVAAQGLIG